MTSIYLVSQDGESIIGEFKNHVGANIVINDENSGELTFEIEATEATEPLENQARLLVKFMDDWYEFIALECEVIYGEYHFRKVKAYPAHDDLRVIHFLPPFSFSQRTVTALLDYVLYDSGWQVGNVDYTANQRSFSSEHIKSAHQLIGEISNIIGHEVRYRYDVDESKNKITRYVDLIIDTAELSGKEVKFRRDMRRLNKSLNYSQVFTQLHIIGPETEGVAERPTTTVTDHDAFELYNRNGNHVQDTYEPQITADFNTVYALIERMRVLGFAELRKRNRHAIEWEIDVRRLDTQPGMEHEQYRLHQWIIIRNEFENALYRSKISQLSGRLSDPSSATVTFSRVEKVGDMDV